MNWIVKVRKFLEIVWKPFFPLIFLHLTAELWFDSNQFCFTTYVLVQPHIKYHRGYSSIHLTTRILTMIVRVLLYCWNTFATICFKNELYFFCEPQNLLVIFRKHLKEILSPSSENLFILMKLIGLVCRTKQPQFSVQS